MTPLDVKHSLVKISLPIFSMAFFLNDIMSGLTIRSPKLSHAD